jgi:hypothetical protein
MKNSLYISKAVLNISNLKVKMSAKSVIEISEEIINLEKAALEKWGKGDPSGFIEISAEDVVYFDPYLEKRIDNKNELISLYETIRGKIFVDSFELLNPKVQVIGDAAVLTFNYQGYVGEQIHKWNCTEVYAFRKNEWKIIQTHWSLTKPSLTL